MVSCEAPTPNTDPELRKLIDRSYADTTVFLRKQAAIQCSIIFAERRQPMIDSLLRVERRTRELLIQ